MLRDKGNNVGENGFKIFKFSKHYRNVRWSNTEDCESLAFFSGTGSAEDIQAILVCTKVGSLHSNTQTLQCSHHKKSDEMVRNNF